jgi:hypothetical protein
MGAVQREPGLLVGPDLVGVIGEAPGPMTAGTIGPELAEMEILVTRDAVARGLAELQGTVTTGTGRAAMGVHEHEPEAVMIEAL